MLDGLQPERAFKKAKHIEDFKVFTDDVQDTIKRLLPTGGRRYERTVILAIDFSKTDFDVKEPRDELLAYLSQTYNWEVEYHTVDCNDHWKKVKSCLGRRMFYFYMKYVALTMNENCLVVYYFSGYTTTYYLNKTELIIT